ncbi:homoserine dehydrogenase [Hyphobacterium marinum]|uniref:Homoserine dehydrogenase n=1 Tax=Hyphobacterium marinum TaxID=3116574 RepID=A0ABU7LX63_9PROT|nr:hypothetical protein [Hyphobacterium sp. Y6023]MEE2565780.1 hypothetical protein [Hyphobacterium sp. Y6023]
MSASSTLLDPVRPARAVPLRAVLLGCGTVGGGVAAALPQGLSLSGVLTRTRRDGVGPNTPVFSRLQDIQALHPHIVIETLPGGPLAEAALDWAVGISAHVVTANKAAVARRPDLVRRARAQNTAFACSAAVGGGVPVLESIERLQVSGHPPASVRAVLNGTSNFVLDRLADGGSLDEAVPAAQQAGFAEADPSADLDGLDAAAKLVLIARTAWDVDLDPDAIPVQSIRDLPAGAALRAAQAGVRLRQVARLDRTDTGLHASVTLEAVRLDDPLARARREENVVILTSPSRPPLILSGKGAGRGPTSASVLGDVRRVLSGHWR